MKRIIISFGWLMAACVAIAGTGTSNEFRLDCRTGVRTAAATEKIQYSTAWATNLTAAQQGEAKAVVKVNPCLKTPPKYLVVDMSGGRSAARWPVSYLDEVPSGGWTDEYKTEKLVLRYIPAGSFIMGGRATDYPGAVNTNLHMVTLTKPFYIGVFECTQRQWELAMGTRPSMMTNEQYYAVRPVEGISFNMIRGKNIGNEWPYSTAVDNESFVSIIRAKTGFLSFDLPSEAQWEYACRGGSATALNTGENLSSEIHSDEVDLVGRYYYNSGMAGNPVDWAAIAVRFGNSAPNEATSVVGAYAANSLGLFDMHGNILEWCLDRASVMRENLAIDPVGPDQEKGYRVVRGGSWIAPAYECTSSHYYVRGFHGGMQATYSSGSLGFRICLHDAIVYPSADSATVLVDASGASAADWTPTRAGTYQLTHEVQVDGVTVAPMESALFKVEGPELKIVPMGELTNGVAVKVEKVGGGGEWTVYYSLDGSEPTAGSTVYEGPFVLPESATVKAVAISSIGVSSEVSSRELALHPALVVEDTKARQRYPWNGKVDIDCEITGDETKKYAVTFSVEDEIGHTNLPIRTVSPVDRVLSPGKYRFVWDAAADLPKGTRFGGVSVSIDAVPSPLADWKRVVEITVDGYAGSETLTDVPVLVRLSSAIEGFDYNDFAAPDTGVDMIFTDMDGVARYPYEIDEWHQDGESLVWVKLPELRKETKFKLAYGNAQYAIEQSNNPNNRTLSTHSVWREYAGVWHMNEDSGTAFDSTEHGLDALPSFGTNTNIDVSSEMKAYERGICGRARENEISEVNETKGCGNYLLTPSYDALGLGGRFIVSGWFRAEQVVNYPRMISRKYESSDKSGWEIHPRQNSSTNISVRGATGGSVICPTPEMKEAWVNITAIYSDAVFSCFTNGVLSLTGESVAATDNGLGLAFGCNPPGNENTWCGQYDEIRLRGGSLSADRIKADYDMIANRDFCIYGKVEAGPGAEPVPPSTTYRVRFNANGGTGTMADEVFEVGVAKALTANAFKRTGYTFQGWATSTDGEVEYSDKQSVVNLTTSGSTVNLFAIWKGVVPVVNGLIAYWPFNGDINDYSGNSHHLLGTVSYGNDRNGVSKSAATFTGSAFLTQKTDLGVTGSMTFSCWVGSPTYTVSRDDIEMYLAAVGRGNFGQHWVYWPLIVFPASVTDGRGVGFSVAANRINVFANGEWFNVILDYSCDISSGWHHVAVTIGTTNSPVLYLDGVKVKEGSSAWNGFVPKLSSANTIGGGDYRAGGKYKGQLDDLCIYNRILSANEIKALHDAR